MRTNNRDETKYKATISSQFCILSLAISVVAAFGMGCAARNHLMGILMQSKVSVTNHSEAAPGSDILGGALSFPDVHYVACTVDCAWNTMGEETAANECIVSTSISEVEELEEDEDEEEEAEEEGGYTPFAQHILVDIRNIQDHALSSTEPLVDALTEFVDRVGWTLLEYHCHTYLQGITCLAFLEESHVVFHTHPHAGSMSVDILTWEEPEASTTIPLVPVVEEIFGRNLADPDDTSPRFLWGLKGRGVDVDLSDLSKLAHFEVDMQQFLYGVMEMELKEQVVSKTTLFQHVDIYDVIEPRFRSLERYIQSLSNDDSYESKHPEYFSPDRIIYLDGVMQSRRFGEAAYHEALVHPAMMAHDNPRKVAIIGGGEGATLREVLKHKTVEKAIMVEIDEMLVNISKEYLPEWSDCSDFGSSEWCFDDPRADVYYQDAIAWFIDRYSSEPASGDEEAPEELDVIIMDALDPQNDVPFADALYKDSTFLRSLYNALSEEGVLVVQVGEAPYSEDPAEIISAERNRALMINNLDEIGFESIHMYEEAHGLFLGIWSYIIAFKSFGTRKNWYANEAQVNLAIQKRVLASRSDHSPLRYFDGATMALYQYPSSAAEAVFCRNEPTPASCPEGDGFDPEVPNVPLSSFQVKTMDEAETPGRKSLTTLEDIPSRAFVGLEAAANALHVPPSSLHLIYSLKNKRFARATKSLTRLVADLGVHNEHIGDIQAVVDGNMLTFTGQSCNSSDLLGVPPVSAAEIGEIPEGLDGRLQKQGAIYNVNIDRNHRRFSNTITALRPVSQGSEIREGDLGLVGGGDKYWKYAC